MIRNRALVALSLFALGGCSGGSHDSQSRTTQQGAVAIAVAPGATPFGVAAPGATSSASSTTAAASAAPSELVAPASPGAASAGPVASSAAAAPVPVGTASPRILSVQTSPAVVHDGDTLLWNVRTTPDVVDVVAHVAVYAFRLQKQGTGQYVLTFSIPHGVPGFFHGNYTLDLVARSVTGVEATTKVPVSFQ